MDVFLPLIVREHSKYTQAEYAHIDTSTQYRAQSTKKRRRGEHKTTENDRRRHSRERGRR